MLQFGYRSEGPATTAGRGAERWVEYSAITRRPPLRWPGDCRLALWICPNILHYEPMPPTDPWLDAWPRMPQPDVFAFGRQTYGVRIGFWRMLEVLDKHGARCTAVVNSQALQRYPLMLEAALVRGWDFVGHGQCNTRFTFGLSRAEELAYYRRMKADVERLTGTPLAGSGGPGPQVATGNTIDVIAEAGFSYYTDLFCDDQPFLLLTDRGRLVSMPYTIELNDPGFLGSSYEAEQFADAVMRQFDVLYEEGRESGRVMCISLHGYLFGQPQRARHLDRALSHIASHAGVWHATGAEICAHFLAEIGTGQAACAPVGDEG
jgi:peptidoglycan/xylan/chitin deacetylase (PgdA/CDA1 family)